MSNNKETEIQNDHTPSFHRGPIDNKIIAKSYKKTLKQVQKELSPSNYIFSKLIHNEVIEKSSDFISFTIARPNAVLSGSIMAFVVTLSVYLLSKTIGYQLSGSESIIAFIIGWIAGIVFDYLKIIFTGKKD